jgi:glycerol kinase
MSRFIAAIDQGTTSTRCMVFDFLGNVIAIDQKEHRQIFPQPGWVEHDALEIWQRTQEVVQNAMNKSDLTIADIAAVGITNQRETAVVWNRLTGLPYGNAIVWQDTRMVFAMNWRKMAVRTDSARKPVCPWQLIFQVQKSNGYWKISQVSAMMPKKVLLCLETSIPGSSGI